MDEENIFIYLKENKKHIEDYFTKILVFFLKNNRMFREQFIDKLLGINDIGGNRDISVGYNLPYPPRNKRPDITIFNKDILILIEIKIKSELGDNQLIDYSEIIKYKLKKNKIKKGFVVFLPKYFEPVQNYDKSNIKINTNNNLIELNWSNIYKFFREDESFTNEIGWLKNQYIELMEDENMQPFEKMNKKNLNDMGKEFSNIIRLFSELKKRLSSAGIEFDNKNDEGFVKLYTDNFLEMKIKKNKNSKYDLFVSFDIGEPAFCLFLGEESKNIQEGIKKIKNYIKNHPTTNLTFEEEEGKWYSNFLYKANESELFSQEVTEEKQIGELVKFYIDAIEIVKKSGES